MRFSIIGTGASGTLMSVILKSSGHVVHAQCAGYRVHLYVGKNARAPLHIEYNAFSQAAFLGELFRCHAL